MAQQVRDKRQVWMATLAQADLAQLETQYRQVLDRRLKTPPSYQTLRPPEVGLTMVRGRTGGTGETFNLGEITLTRCVLQLMDRPLTGFGYVAGRSKRHAELAALCDALLQHPDWHDSIQAQVVEPLQAIAAARHQEQSAEVEATRVNFFTMLRGE